MSYIGNKPATNFETVRKQVSTTNSGTTITLDFAVSSVQDILVTVNAVVQSYDNYSVSGTTLTLGGTLNNDRVEILYVGRTFQTVTPAIGTVTNDMLSGSIANSKLANSSITLNGSAVSLGGSATVGGTNTPSFHVYRNATQNISNNTYERVQFDTEVWDTANAYDNSTNYRYTPNEAGKYVFYVKISIYSGTHDNVKFQTILFKKNGTDSAVHSLDSRNGYYMGYGNGMYFEQVLDMNGSSDYIDAFFYFQVNNTSDLRIIGGASATYFGGYKLIGV
jgi:hypothetical protein